MVQIMNCYRETKTKNEKNPAANSSKAPQQWTARLAAAVRRIFSLHFFPLIIATREYSCLHKERNKEKNNIHYSGSSIFLETLHFVPLEYHGNNIKIGFFQLSW